MKQSTKNALTVLGILIALGYTHLAEHSLHRSPAPQKPVSLALKPAVIALPDCISGLGFEGGDCGNGPG